MNNNILASNLKIAAAFSSPEILVEPGEIINFAVLIESIDGTPTSASLAAKIQIAPVEYNGLSWNTDSTSGVQRPWIDVTPSDTFSGHLLIDGAFPASLADQTLAAHRLVCRRFKVPPIGQIVRIVLTPAFSGGTSPSYRVTIATATDQP